MSHRLSPHDARGTIQIGAGTTLGHSSHVTCCFGLIEILHLLASPPPWRHSGMQAPAVRSSAVHTRHVCTLPKVFCRTPDQRLYHHRNSWQGRSSSRRYPVGSIADVECRGHRFVNVAGLVCEYDRGGTVLQRRMSASASLQQALVTKQKFSTFTNKEGDLLI